MFTVTGIYQGREVFLTWDEGRIEGDPEFIKALEKHAEKRDYVEVIGMGPISTNAHLSKPLPAAWLMGELLDSVISRGGDFPKLPDVPDDAVI